MNPWTFSRTIPRTFSRTSISHNQRCSHTRGAAMRKNRPSTDCPPELTGDLDADTDAALAWLYAHPDAWLTEDGGSPNGGVAA